MGKMKMVSIFKKTVKILMLIWRNENMGKDQNEYYTEKYEIRPKREIKRREQRQKRKRAE